MGPCSRGWPCTECRRHASAQACQRLFEFCSTQYIEPQPPNPVRACPYPGQPLAPHSPPPPPYEVGNQKHKNSDVSLGQPALFLVRKCFCARVTEAIAIERRRRRRAYTYTYIGVCVCVCAWTGYNSKALVVLQGTVMSSSHHSTVFSYQCESHHSRSPGGEVCICRAKWEVFWSWILSMPLPLERVLSRFLYSRIARIIVQRSFDEAAPVLILWEDTYPFITWRDGGQCICSSLAVSSSVINLSDGVCMEHAQLQPEFQWNRPGPVAEEKLDLWSAVEKDFTAFYCYKVALAI